MACGTQRAPHLLSNCGRISIRLSGSTYCWRRLMAGARGPVPEACGCCVRSGSSRRCWASATALRARFTTLWRRGTWESQCSLKFWLNCCATTRWTPRQATGHHPRARARRARRCAAIDLGSAFAGRGREDVAGEAAAGHGAGNGRHLEAKFSVFGAYRPMPPGTEREILRVAQEAIHNVKKHAEATTSVGAAGVRAGRDRTGSAG